MSNSLYQTTLSRLAVVSPLFAKTLLDRAIDLKGKTPDSITALDLLEIIKTEINPKLAREEHKYNDLLQASSSFVIYNAKNEVVFASTVLARLFDFRDENPSDKFKKLAKFGICHPISELSELLASELILPGNPQKFEVCSVPIFDQDMRITGGVSFLRDVTLKAAIEDEVIQQGQKLREEIAARVTAQRELELNQEQLVQSSKLASLGEMASGIAHEVNNPLSVVFGGIELIEMSSRRNTLDAKSLENGLNKIRNAATRIKQTVEAMRNLSRNDDRSGLKNYSLTKLLNEVLSLCQEKYQASGVEVKLTTDADYMIDCFPVELGQVFINLLNNSFDAIAILPAKFIHIYVSREQSEVRVSVVDSGSGIPKEVESKMFDPFFTTKPVGKGVGIGMSISKKIVLRHNGRIRIDRTSPYTKIDVFLPL